MEQNAFKNVAVASAHSDEVMPPLQCLIDKWPPQHKIHPGGVAAMSHVCHALVLTYGERGEKRKEERKKRKRQLTQHSAIVGVFTLANMMGSDLTTDQSLWDRVKSTILLGLIKSSSQRRLASTVLQIQRPRTCKKQFGHHAD